MSTTLSPMTTKNRLAPRPTLNGHAREAGPQLKESPDGARLSPTVELELPELHTPQPRKTTAAPAASASRRSAWLRSSAAPAARAAEASRKKTERPSGPGYALTSNHRPSRASSSVKVTGAPSRTARWYSVQNVEPTASGNTSHRSRPTSSSGARLSSSSARRFT